MCFDKTTFCKPSLIQGGPSSSNCRSPSSSMMKSLLGPISKSLPSSFNSNLSAILTDVELKERSLLFVCIARSMFLSINIALANPKELPDVVEENEVSLPSVKIDMLSSVIALLRETVLECWYESLGFGVAVERLNLRSKIPA
ncbi:hypothetical protein OGAPHI_002708 [Ogataea philodendri]|uniref:Uncharacterized protein n=1 Tax=Ogataea philodendri TaxID=1378263 RepID=A0A9P8PB53_9ASCO|nr:uncharacterized protein OGAPHI_002708 [Ogataea philodendri]KAH3668953.1 hypothetical protein OGAPHI_002708 [Ogataea philodendri]